MELFKIENMKENSFNFSNIDNLRKICKFNDVLTWGSNKSRGKLGYTKKYDKTPKILKQLRGLGSVFIETGKFHSAVITEEGKDVYVWGCGEKGQLGRGDIESQTIPRLIISLRNKYIRMVSCGYDHTLALTNDSILYAFGSNEHGQLGIKSDVKLLSLPEIVKGPWCSGDDKESLISISCGNGISAVISKNKNLYLWGNGENGLLCNNDDSFSDQYIPKKVSFIENIIKDIQFGDSHCLALTVQGSVLSWGSNKFGQIGLSDPSIKNIKYPLQIIIKNRNNFIKQIACGSFHSACLTEDGEVYTFGYGGEGQLGNGIICEYQYEPVKVVFPESLKGDEIVKISCGSHHNLCLTKLGRVFGWGLNNQYQLGLGSKKKKQFLSPTLINTLQSLVIQSISCGGDSSAVVTGRPMTVNIPLTSIIPINVIMEVQNLKVFVGTFNINGQQSSLSTDSLSTWIYGTNKNMDEYDIIAIGFQELVSINSKSVAKDLIELEESKMKLFCEEKLNLTISGEKNNFVQIFSKQLVGIMLVIYVKKEISLQIKNISWDQVRVGVMHKMGNKGAIAVRFSLYENEFCFINCHLAAGNKKNSLERRNQDYRDILSKICFKHENNSERKVGISDHENIFWFGDMNYRLTIVNKDFVNKLLLENNLYLLSQYDQLLQEKQAERIFIGFKEGLLNFPPTYKYDLSSLTYDTSEKSRIPAWCDRILWRGENITQINYQRHEIITSDHRPVSSLFHVKLNIKNNNYNYSFSLPELNISNEDSLTDDEDSSEVSSLDEDSNFSDNNKNQEIHSQLAKKEHEIFATVIHNYQPEDSNELELNEGENVIILKMDNSGWWKAKKKIGNEYKIGWIPSNFVKLCKSIPNFNLNNENNNKQYNDVIEKDSLIIKQGYMIKKGHIRRNWKTRYFILKKNSLSYYASKILSHEPLDIIDLSNPDKIKIEYKGCISKKGLQRNIFSLTVLSDKKPKEYLIDAQTNYEAQHWVQCIQNVLEFQKLKKK